MRYLSDLKVIARLASDHYSIHSAVCTCGDCDPYYECSVPACGSGVYKRSAISSLSPEADYSCCYCGMLYSSARPITASCRVSLGSNWYHIDEAGIVYRTDSPVSSRWVDHEQVDDELARRVRLEALSLSYSKEIF